MTAQTYFDANPQGLPPDVLITALASRLADLQGARVDPDSSAITPPTTQGDAGRRALVAGHLLAALEQRLETGDSGFVPLSVVADGLKEKIVGLELEELRFCVRFLDVDREIRYQQVVDGVVQDHRTRTWSRLVRYQARLDRVKLSEAGRLWIRVLRHREHWLFEDKEVEKIVAALHGGFFDRIPDIAAEVVTSIRLFNEHLTAILESPSFRELVRQYLQHRAHFSGMIDRCHLAAIQALEIVGTQDAATRHENWLPAAGARGISLGELRVHVVRVHRATESLRRRWDELLDAVQQEQRPRVGLVRFDLALDAFLAMPPSEDAMRSMLDGLGGWGSDADYLSILDVEGCLPEAIEPEAPAGAEFDLNAAPVNAKMQSWLTRHRARLLAALKAGPKSLFEFLDDGMLAIETPFDIAGLFGTYVMVEPFGKRVAVVVERREGLKAVDRVGHRLTASDIRLRLEEKTR